MRENMLNKVLITFIALAGGVALFSEAFAQATDGAGAGQNVTTTIETETNKNGKVTKETEVHEGLGGGSAGNASVVSAANAGGGASASNNAGSSEGNSAQTETDAKKAEADSKAEEERKAKEKEEEERAKYNGLYNGFHIIPDIMAMHCKIMGEDVAKDPELYVDCIKQYVSEMNNANAAAKAEAEKEYQLLRYKTLTDDGATAITKAQITEKQTDVENEHGEAMSEGQTSSDDNKALMAALMFVTNVMNDLRELQVKDLEYAVISGIADIDPSIIMEEEEAKEKEEEKSESNGNNSGPVVNSVNVEAKAETN